MTASAGPSSPPVADLAQVEGVPECALGDALEARLPPASAAAPWETRVQAVMWLHPATGAAAGLLPERLRAERTLPLTIGAFIRYLDTPVGAYSEILASPLLLARAPMPASHVPFIAVDSLPSIHGGRANWSLPKTLGAFEWSAEPDALGRRAFRVRGEGAHGPVAWSVSAEVTPRRRRLPLRFPLRDVQLTPDGRELDIPIRLAGSGQLATVEVRTDGPTLPSWLRPGRHHALVIPQARMTFGAPR